MAEQIKWPVHIYNAAGQLAVCDNLTQLDAAKAKGFTQPYRHQAFPTVRWNRTTGAVVRITNAKDLADYSTDDWLDTPVAVPELAKPAEAAPVEPAMIRDLRAEIAALEKRVEWLEAVATAPVEAAAEEKPRRKGTPGNPVVLDAR